MSFFRFLYFTSQDVSFTAALGAPNLFFLLSRILISWNILYTMIPLKDENPTNRYPAATVLIICVNVLIFLTQAIMTREAEWLFVHRYGAIPLALVSGQDPFPSDTIPLYATTVTSLFLHGGILHLAGNMLYLWIFGNNIEDVLGHVRFIIFYLLCGIVATLIYAFFHAGSTAPLIGASGAIAGVMGAYIYLFPQARVLTLILIIIYPVLIWLPAIIVLGLWLLFQFLNAGGSGETGVAWTAHIAGFFCGMILIRIMVGKPPPRARRDHSEPPNPADRFRLH
jgi:membrane associated rhomboid family serine protease